MPSSQIDSTYWEIDFEVIQSLPGAADLENWFGFLPSFHDATISSAKFFENQAILNVEAFRMTKEVDQGGYYVCDRQALVTFTMCGVRAVVSQGELTTTILELGVRKVSEVTAPLEAMMVTEGDFEIGFDTSYGTSGSIFAKSVEIEVFPRKQAE